MFLVRRTHRGQSAQSLVGLRFGRFVVIEQAPSHKAKTTVRAMWKCRCDCGQERTVQGTSLRRGTSTSCGCYQKELVRQRLSTHGESHQIGKRGSARYEMLRGARARAKEFGVPFDLDLTDISIPEKCPVLDIPLVSTTSGRPTTNSPSLDRITFECACN